MNEDGKANFSVYYAKSFYNAFIALEQINQNSSDEMLYRIPVMVNGAFSIEITLKAMLRKCRIEYKKEHILINLFRMLPNSFQEEILMHLTEKAPEYSDIHKLSEELILISDLFVDWRYAFEGNVAPAVDLRFISAFANAAIWTMFSHYNVDLVKRDDSVKTDKQIEDMISDNREKAIEKISRKLKEGHNKK